MTTAVQEAKQESRVKTHFDTVADTYASFYQGQTSEAHSFTIRLKRVLEMLPSELGTLVDIGCGPGILLREVLDRDLHARRIVGTDFAPNMIAQAQERLAAGGLAGKAELRVASVMELPFDSASVDTAVCMGLMEYLDDESAAVAEIARILRPGGSVIITLPNRWSPYRLWQRLLNRTFKGLQRAFPNSKRLTQIEFMVGPFTKGVAHREYSERAYRGFLKRQGFSTTDVCYYNYKLFLTPLDKRFPAATVRVSRALECLGRAPLLRMLSTAFIIKARKTGDEAKA